MSDSKTVRVRIAVCVDQDGFWAASGGRTPANYTPEDSDEEDRGLAEDALLGRRDGAPRGIVWVEADVPLPAEQTVEGEVQA